MFAGKKSAQIREILISESAWEEMTCLFAPSLDQLKKKVEEEHACNNGIYLYDKSGLKKLDALSWAVYHKMKAEKKAKQG